MQKAVKIYRIATLIIFLALIRCILEPFRLQYYASEMLTLPDIKMYLTGAAAAAAGLLVMTLLSFWEKYNAGTAVASLTFVVLLLIKWVMS